MKAERQKLLSARDMSAKVAVWILYHQKSF